MHSINLFMWGYQSHFRATLEYRAKRVFELIGADVEPEVLLVGVARPDRNPKHPISIEPEDGRWSLSAFSSVPEQLEETIKTHPMQNMFYGDALSMGEKPEKIRRLVITEAVNRQLRLDDDKDGVRSFCSTAYPVEDYYVVCVIQVPSRLFRQFPPITYRWQTEDVESSLIHECLRVMLDEARTALTRPDPGRLIGEEAMRTPDEMVERAARSFMRIPFIGQFSGADLFERYNKLSQLMYEGRTGAGRVVLAAADDPNVQYILRFATPVPLSEVRWARKALQMASKETGLIAGYDSIYGLGRASDVSAPPYCIDVLDHNQWEFKRGDAVLMRSRFGEARLPQEPISADRFIDNMHRIFKGISEAAVSRFRIVLDLLVQLSHGSMLVIARDAAAEARRLQIQATVIKPTPLTKELLERATNIDGTILADPDGVCHAVGVILDGEANESCTASRGARYNSAVRYVGNKPGERMAFVISEDRTLDVIPLLRRRASRKQIEKAVEAISQATPDNYHKARSFLDEHRFYLDGEQCSTINQALDRIENSTPELGRIILVTARFEPNPAMDYSYLKD